MAEQIISPGVFTRENDQSFLPAGVGAIGAAIVGPTLKGPAFVPTVINSFKQYEDIFGVMTDDTFVPHTVRNYLRTAGTVTVCRVLAGGGYTYAEGTNEYFGLFASGACDYRGSVANDHTLLGVIMPSKALSTPDLSLSVIESGSTHADQKPIMSASFSIILRGSTGGSGVTGTGTTYSASLNPSNTDYLFKQVSDNPNNSKTAVDQYDGDPGYAYLNFEEVQTTTAATGAYGDMRGIGSGSHIVVLPMLGSTTQTWSGYSLSQTEGYSYSSTPWIRSQFVDTNKTTKQLFKIHTLAHGTSVNKDFKVSIANQLTPDDINGVPQYTTFSLILREYSDKDNALSIVQSWNNLTLDPDSTNYIGRAIGDQYPQYNDTLDKVEVLGNYPNNSKYIRVEVASSVEDKASSPSLLPKGFSAILDPINTSSFVGVGGKIHFPSASYEGTQQVGGVYDELGFLGWKTTEKETSGKHNENWLLPLPDGAQANCSGEFNVDNYHGHSNSSLWSGSLSASIDSTGNDGPKNTQLQFTVPFQGGDDGIRSDIVRFTGGESTLSSNYTNSNLVYGFDLSSATSAGTTGYKKALDILSNQDEYDINMLVLPGLNKRYHSTVTAKGISMVEGRGDCFYVMDVVDKEASVATAITTVSGMDSNYTATYYPWVKIDGSIKPILVPPSVVVPGAIAQSDAIAGGAEWFAPAGLNRGVLGRVRDVKIRLNQSERDRLYEAKINPIASFPGITNPVIWGQKTLQSRSTALNRINVRRLLIAVKKYIASSSKYLVFEQNTTKTRNRFLNIVNPYLEGIQQKQGLYAFRVQMDEENNTPDVVDRNQLVGAIYLQPAKTAEFIVLDFNVLPTGATFE